MTILTGWLGTFDETVGSEAVRTMSSESGTDTRVLRVGPRTVAITVSTEDGSIHQRPGLVVAIMGSPVWCEDRLAAMAAESDHATAAAQAYSGDPTALLNRLRGSFALFLYDGSRDEGILAIDRIGIAPLCYKQYHDQLIFSTSLAALRRHPDNDPELSLQAVYDYVYAHAVPAPTTIYNDHGKLLAGHFLRCVARDQAAQIPYWLPSFQNESPHSTEQLAQELQALLYDCVAESAGDGCAGAFLSGGLDSSTVAGMLARQRPAKADTFSIGFHVPGYDEIPYARKAAEWFGTRPHEYYLTPADATEAVPDVAGAYEEPFGNSSALPALYCARLARDTGVDHLLAGDGGDELFGGNERYRKQSVFELYNRLLPESLRKRCIEPALGHEAGWHQWPGLSKAVSYVRQARVPLPDRLQTYNFLHRIDPRQVFTPEFLAQVSMDAPLQRMRETYNAPQEASTLDRMLYLDWRITLQDSDLVKVTRMCQLAGVRVSFPLLDDRLVEFSCRVPSRLKIRRGQLRWFYKHALRDFLPGDILNKRKHGFGLPFGVWTRTEDKLRQLAYDSVLALRKRQLFRTDFLDHAIQLHREGHAAYYGELIWILMMLELWFGSHGQAAAKFLRQDASGCETNAA